MFNSQEVSSCLCGEPFLKPPAPRGDVVSLKPPALRGDASPVRRRVAQIKSRLAPIAPQCGAIQRQRHPPAMQGASTAIAKANGIPRNAGIRRAQSSRGFKTAFAAAFPLFLPCFLRRGGPFIASRKALPPSLPARPRALRPGPWFASAATGRELGRSAWLLLLRCWPEPPRSRP
jgi:hypothetical protein